MVKAHNELRRNKGISAFMITLLSGTAVQAADFTVANGVTQTTTMSLGAGQTGLIEQGGTLSVTGTAVDTRSAGVTVTNNGTISSTGFGIYLTGNNFTGVNNGTITSDTQGLYIGASYAKFTVGGSGTITGDNYGIYNTGPYTQITINEGGRVTSDSMAIHSSGTLSEITVSGTVTSNHASNAAINSTGGSSKLTINQNGTVTSNGAGIYANYGLSIVNAGTITGGNGTAITFASRTNSLELHSTSNITGKVYANGTDTLILGGSSNGTFDLGKIGDQYLSFESFSKSGTSTWTLTGTGNQAWTASAGTLQVNGTAGTINVQSGGSLGGTGTVGQTTVASGGIHAPGNSVGTQTISGNYQIGSGGILLIEVDSAGNADQVVVNGTVDITGSTLRVTHISDTNFNGSDSYDYVIISNDGVDAVTGDFASIDNKLAFYDATRSTTGGDGNDVTLKLTRNRTVFEDHAKSGNQSAVAGVLNSLPGTDGQTLRSAIMGLSTSWTEHAYEQLSGDVHNSGGAVTSRINGQANGQVGGRLSVLRSGGTNAGTLVAGSTLSPATLTGFASAGPMASDQLLSDSDGPMLALGDGSLFQTGGAIWLQAIGGIGRIDGDSNVDATDYTWAGMIGGYDTALFDHTQVGVYFGYADGKSRQSNRDATLDTGNYMVGLYSNHEMTDDWSISTQAGWTRIVTDSRRNLDFGGISRTATAGYINNTLGADIELAKGFDLGDVQGNSWRIEPYGMLGILWSDNDGFTETGAGSANLSRAADSELTGTAGLGFRLAGMIVAGDGKTLIPQFRLGWDHHVGPVSSSSTLAFSGTPSFTVSGGEVDRNTLRGNMGFALADDDGWSIYADYQPSVSENAHEHAFGAGFRMKF